MTPTPATIAATFPSACAAVTSGEIRRSLAARTKTSAPASPRGTVASRRSLATGICAIVGFSTPPVRTRERYPPGDGGTRRRKAPAAWKSRPRGRRCEADYGSAGVGWVIRRGAAGLLFQEKAGEEPGQQDQGEQLDEQHRKPPECPDRAPAAGPSHLLVADALHPQEPVALVARRRNGVAVLGVWQAILQGRRPTDVIPFSPCFR